MGKQSYYRTVFLDEYKSFLKKTLPKEGYSASESNIKTILSDTFYLDNNYPYKDFLLWFKDEESLNEAKETLCELINNAGRKKSSVSGDIKAYSRDLDYFYKFYNSFQSNSSELEHRKDEKNINSLNPRIGATFQKQVALWFEKEYSKAFLMEKGIEIGNPGKEHRFDIIAEDGSIAIECKCYTWTASGNVPSAKMGFVNEAAFYLSFLPDKFEKYIVMSKSSFPGKKETLAEYYYRINKHLLGSTRVAEYDTETGEMRFF